MKMPPSITQSFQMQYEYQLHFTNGLFSKDNGLLGSLFSSLENDRPVKLLVVLDSGVANAHPHSLGDIRSYAEANGECLQLQEIVQVPGGERAKNDKEVFEKVLRAINDQEICRHSFVMAIGGGAVIDMVGYAAAVAHRGVKLIRVPTTVLAQNDAAVGVKNGVNFFGKKNFLGNFSVPYSIINDFRFLDTLEQRDWIAGIAEAVKVAAIKDDAFFMFLEANAKNMAARDEAAMSHMIFRCAQLHMEHIANGGDPFESGSSRPLDFGHWAAHKLEQMTNYGLRHGEAVAMGIALDVTYAYNIGLIPMKVRDRIIKVLQDVGFVLHLPIETTVQVEELMEGIEEFRQHLGGRLTITLLKDIGKKYDVHEIDRAVMRSTIESRMKSMAGFQ